jgi:hypothetical protein
VHAVGKIDLQASRIPVLNHFVHGSGTEELAWIAIFVRASGMANVGLQDLQVTGLVFVVRSAGIVNVRQLVKRQLAVEAR